MAKDVEKLLHRGTWRFKALTAKAREAMGADLGGPWQMAADVFWQGVDESRYPAIIDKLRGMGLQLDDDPPEVPQWEF